MVLTEWQTQLLKWSGFLLFVLANTVIMISGNQPPTVQVRNAKVLSAVCEAYLANHALYDVPPLNCEQELRFLLRRINLTLKEIEDARNDTTMAVPDGKTPERSNP